MLINEMVIELSICQLLSKYLPETNQIRDEASGAPEDFDSIVAINRMIPLKFILSFILHSCL